MSKDKSSNWFARHKVLTIVIILLILIGIGAAASNSNTNTVNTTATNKTKSSTSTNGKSTSPTIAHVGDTVNIGGSKGLAVTLQQIIDPASGADQYTTPNAGDRFIAAEVKIQNNGSASYQDDANNNITLIGTDNQSYTADFDNVSECTNFSNGQYTLAAGESATGCVVFQVPNGVNTAKVQFQSNGGFSGDTGEWLVP